MDQSKNEIKVIENEQNLERKMSKGFSKFNHMVMLKERTIYSAYYQNTVPKSRNNGICMLFQLMHETADSR